MVSQVIKTKSTSNRRKKIDKLHIIVRIKNFCASKDTIKKAKRRPVEWEKIFANHESGKGGTCIKDDCSLISRQRGRLKKRTKDVNGQLSKEDTQNQLAYGKMLNTMSYQGNANQTYNEIPLHTHQDS